MKMLSWCRDRLVENWRLAWRWWSVRFNAAGILILSWVSFDPVSVLWVWNMMPPHVRAFLPHNFITIVGLVLFGLGMLARVIRQPKLEAKNAPGSK